MISRKPKLLEDRIKKISWPRYTTKNYGKKKNVYFFPDDFGSRNPVVQKTFRTKRATSIVGVCPLLWRYSSENLVLVFFWNFVFFI